MYNVCLIILSIYIVRVYIATGNVTRQSISDGNHYAVADLMHFGNGECYADRDIYVAYIGVSACHSVTPKLMYITSKGV